MIPSPTGSDEPAQATARQTEALARTVHSHDPHPKSTDAYVEIISQIEH
jgi:hypothetical protein